MEDIVNLSILFDYYGGLLTDKQRNYFEDYYFNNLTLAEISTNNDISRNAVHKQIKETIEKLNQYENILKLHEKNIKINKLLNKVEDKKLIEEIKELI